MCVNHTLNSREEAHVNVVHGTGETHSNAAAAEETHVLYKHVNNRHSEKYDVNVSQVKKTTKLHRVSSIIMAKSCLPLKDLIQADSHTLSEEIYKTEQARLLQQSELDKLRRLKESRENLKKINDEKIKFLREMRATELILTFQQKELEGWHLYSHNIIVVHNSTLTFLKTNILFSLCSIN